MLLNIALFTPIDKESECSHITLDLTIVVHISGSGVRSGVLVDLVFTLVPIWGVLVDPVSTCLLGPWREYAMGYFSLAIEIAAGALHAVHAIRLIVGG